MKVKELIEKLSEFPEDANVQCVYSVLYSNYDEGWYGEYEEQKSLDYITSAEVPTRKNPNPIVKTVLIHL